MKYIKQFESFVMDKNELFKEISNSDLSIWRSNHRQNIVNVDILNKISKVYPNAEEIFDPGYKQIYINKSNRNGFIKIEFFEDDWILVTIDRKPEYLTYRYICDSEVGLFDCLRKIDSIEI